MTLIMIVIIVFYFVLFELGYIFGRMDKKKDIPQKPLEIKYSYQNLQHVVAHKTVSKEILDSMDIHTIETEVARSLARQLEGVIRDHMTSERDYYRMRVAYMVDAWFKGGSQ